MVERMRYARELATLAVVAAATGAACGDESPAPPSGDTARDPRAYDFYRDHPYALTCGHVLAIHSVKAQQFHIAAHSLAREVRLPRTNRNQVWARLVHALLDICQRAGDPGYRPAREAVRRVRRGEYRLSVGGGPL
jgi:hypothetical protein